MTSRTAPRKRAAAGGATQPRHAPKSAPLDAGRRVQRRGMCRNRHRATRAANRIAISPGRRQRSRTVCAGRHRRSNRKSLPRKTPDDHAAVRSMPKGERRTRQNQARVVDLCRITPGRARTSPQRIPLTSVSGAKRHTMGEFAPDGRYCLPDSGPRHRPANGHHCRRSLSIAAERQGGTRKTRPAGCRPGFRRSIHGQRFS
jgi:hypothetical protein